MQWWNTGTLEYWNDGKIVRTIPPFCHYECVPPFCHCEEHSDEAISCTYSHKNQLLKYNIILTQTRKIDFYMNNNKQYYIYLITNKNNTVIYTGVTSNLIKRIWEHKNKLVKGFTQRYNIGKLVYLTIKRLR